MAVAMVTRGPGYSRSPCQPVYPLPSGTTALRERPLRRVIAQPESFVQPPQGSRRPPVPVPEELHQRGHEQRPDQAGVDQHRQRRPDAVLLDEDDLRGREGADRNREEQRGGGHDPSRPLETGGYSLRALDSRVMRLLDPGEQEDAVVGRETEDDREQQDRHRLLERSLAAVIQQALQPAVLEDEDQDPEGGAQ